MKYRDENGQLKQIYLPPINVVNEKSTSTENSYSCNYVNKIVESNYDAVNGSYIKFGDGTLICHQRKEFTVSFTADGSAYVSSISNPFTFPVSFVANMDLFCSTGNNTDYTFCSVIGVIRNQNGISQINLLRHKAGSGTVCVHYLAIGRWK